MLNRPELRDIALSPGLDRRKLSLNGFVAYGRVEVLRSFFQAAQEVVGRLIYTSLLFLWWLASSWSFALNSTTAMISRLR
jgi:hypothetical protein